MTKIKGILECTSSATIGGVATLFASNDNAFSNSVLFSKERDGAIVQNNDEIGYLDFRGFNGTTYDRASLILCRLDGIPGASGDMPGSLEFHTTPDGSASSSQRMTIKNSGRVGIGTTAPDALLHVEGAGGAVAAPGGQRSLYNNYLNTTWTANIGGSSSGAVGIYGSDFIISGTGYLLHSDERIKTDISKSDSKKDLETLSNIDISDYSYKDKIRHGAERKKKVIAQQIENVYPLATHKSRAVIPDIFKPSEKVIFNAEDKTLEILLNGHGLKEGDEVQLVLDSGEQLFTIQKSSEYQFVVNHDKNQDKIFVYGKKVYDFISVDYEAISMLNVSATQELVKQIEILNSRIEELEKK